jgi:hypothetical protein
VILPASDARIEFWRRGFQSAHNRTGYVWNKGTLGQIENRGQAETTGDENLQVSFRARSEESFLMIKRAQDPK